MATEQQYYDLLTRMDHPVFRKIFEDVSTFDENTPFNAVLNLILARRLLSLKSKSDGLILDSHADTVREVTIDKWEETYFGFTKVNVPFLQRREELLQRFNIDIGLAIGDVVTLAESITGQTPFIVRNAFFAGFTLDDPALGILDSTSILASTDQASDAHLYFVIFPGPVDTQLLALFDEELTAIEKVGSRHINISPPKFWVLDASVTDLDTLLG